MPARFSRFGSLCCIAAISVLLMDAIAWKSFGQGAGTAEAKPEDVKADPDAAGGPADLNQPRTIPPEMEITKELYSDGEEKEFRQKHENKGFADALKAEKLTDENKKMLDLAAKYWIRRMTLEKYRAEEAMKAKPALGEKPPLPKDRKENLADLRKRLLDLIRNGNSGRLSVEVREFFQKAIIAECNGLLDNHYLVRLNAVILVGQLSLNNGNPQKNPPEEPAAYAPGYAFLLGIVKDEKQHISIRIAAVRGLTRICKLGLPDPNDKRRPEIALALASQLSKSDTHYWYQMALAECLATAGLVADPANKNNPVILQALADTIADPKRHWYARCEAARAVGRLNIEPTHAVGPIVAEIVSLGYQMGQAYNANPKREAWSNHFVNLYLAFKPESAKTLAPGGKRIAGLLAALPNSKEVKESYEQIVPLASHVLNAGGKQFTAATLDAVREWLKTRLPAKNLPPNAQQPEAVTQPGSAKPPGAAAANGKPSVE